MTTERIQRYHRGLYEASADDARNAITIGDVRERLTNTNFTQAAHDRIDQLERRNDTLENRIVELENAIGLMREWAKKLKVEKV